MTTVNWTQECPLQVKRDVAAQSGRCATCHKWVGYDNNGVKVWPPKCLWNGWDDPFKEQLT